MKKFEYLVIDIREALNISDAALNTGLNALGDEGWELVTIDNGKAYFKREIEQIEGIVKLSK